MIKVENVVGPSPEQWDIVVQGVRNPMNSWDKSDSNYYNGWNYNDLYSDRTHFEMGEKDLKLMTDLANAGADHGKFLRQLPVICEITAPLYWWKQWDTYKVGTTANACSTMHRLTEKEFRLSDFSISNEMDLREILSNETYQIFFQEVIEHLNMLRKAYLETKEKWYWMKIVELLPESYMQKRTVSLNYAVLKNMYKQRKNHKLSEWIELFEQMLPELAYVDELIIGE